MKTGITLPSELDEQIEHILVDLYSKTEADCVLLADVSGQLISMHGDVNGINPVPVAALAAGNTSAMSELVRQIGEKDPHGSFLHEGEYRSIYLFSIGDSFILVAIFQTDTPIGLIRLFVRRAAERLYALTADFEDVMSQPASIPDANFGAALADEMDKAFAGL